LNNSEKSQNSFQISMDIVYWHQHNFHCLCQNTTPRHEKWSSFSLQR